MDAVLRRLDSVKKEKLRIDSRPASKARLLGIFTGRDGPTPGVRPYRSAILGRRPDRGPMRLPGLPQEFARRLQACPDRPGALSTTRPKLLKQAMQTASGGRESELGRPALGPNPATLGNLGDWLSRVNWVSRGRSDVGKQPRALEWFQAGNTGVLEVADSFPTDTSRRLGLVEDLLKLLPASDRA